MDLIEPGILTVMTTTSIDFYFSGHLVQSTHSTSGQVPQKFTPLRIVRAAHFPG